MDRYSVLLRILDRLRLEAPPTVKKYHPDASDQAQLNAARSRAFIHLLLKVRFGLIEFSQREALITEGENDGGIDAFYIETERKTIYFIQSKFRQTEKNFEAKAIEAEELLRMDIDRVLRGEVTAENGERYNGKILGMARQIRQIRDIGRYQYQVIILANARGITRQKLAYLTGGFHTELIDYQKCYAELVFPLVSGTFYTASELQLSLTLSNKSAGAKISYSVTTEHARIEITVVFVPTLEIAKAMYKYRNAILKYNPRSFLEHEGQTVNREIRRSIERRRSNEFALFNNGITMLSDDTYLNERIGQKDRAQLVLLNPQIINGGQTAYTLSQIYRDHIDSDVEALFGEKEVLLKILTFNSGEDLSQALKLSLIEDISKATNSQTVVTKADRRSNEPELQDLQARCFDLGLFLERKRGEFADGINEGYVDPRHVVDRTTFLRAAMIAQGKLNEALSKKLAASVHYKSLLNVEDDLFRDYKLAVVLFRRIHHESIKKQKPKVRFESAVKTFVAFRICKDLGVRDDGSTEVILNRVTHGIVNLWHSYLDFALIRHSADKNLIRLKRNGKKALNLQLYYRSQTMEQDIRDFFEQHRRVFGL